MKTAVRSGKTQMKELEALTEISKAISSSLDLKTVIQNILNILHEHLGMERGTITLLDPETKELSIEVACGLDLEEIKRGRYKIGEGITGKVVAAGGSQCGSRTSFFKPHQSPK